MATQFGSCTSLLNLANAALLTNGFTDGAGTWSMPFFVPSGTWLVGLPLITQTVVLQSAGPLLGVATLSNALDLRPGDLLLLASDGLTGKLAQGDLESRMRQVGDGDLDAALADLIAEANRRGGEDNITALFVRVDG